MANKIALEGEFEPDIILSGVKKLCARGSAIVGDCWATSYGELRE